MQEQEQEQKQEPSPASLEDNQPGIGRYNPRALNNQVAEVPTIEQASGALQQTLGKPAKVPMALEGISHRARMMREIAVEIPNNDFGLPQFILRSDLLPQDLADMELVERHQAIDLATIPLDYDQGYPLLPNGEPIWSQLVGESSEAFRAFVTYLDMPRVHNTSGSVRGGRARKSPGSAVRQIHELKDELGKSPTELLNYSYLYFWAQRARAYDLFITVSHSKRREYLLQDIENEHLERADRLLQTAERFIDEVFQDPERFELKPADAIRLMKEMMATQRTILGAGLSQSKNGSDALPAGAPLEVILRTLVQKAGLNTSSNNDAALKDITNQLYDDADSLQQAQELIIRVNEPQGRS